MGTIVTKSHGELSMLLVLASLTTSDSSSRKFLRLFATTSSFQEGFFPFLFHHRTFKWLWVAVFLLCFLLFLVFRAPNRVCRIFLMINLEHGLKDKDFEFLEDVARYHINILPVFTKIDQIPQEKRMERAFGVSHQLLKFPFVSHHAHLTSSK